MRIPEGDVPSPRRIAPRLIEAAMEQNRPVEAGYLPGSGWPASGRSTRQAGVHAIDHAVLPVTTLTLARSRLTALGFTVAPDARHPFGTGNCCVFFENHSYLEPITIQDRDAADEAAAEGVYFVRRLKRFTERHGEGFAMLALSTGDAEGERRRFEDAGVSAGDVFSFNRMATLPDGTERKLGFSLAFAETAKAPDATLFACRHLDRDALLQPERIAHANTATGIRGVAAVAAAPGEFADLLAAATDRTPDVSPDSIETTLDGQSIAVLTPEAFRGRYDSEPPDPRRGLLFAAIEIDVSDMDRAAERVGGAARRGEHRIVVPPAPGLSTLVTFESRAHG